MLVIWVNLYHSMFITNSVVLVHICIFVLSQQLMALSHRILSTIILSPQPIRFLHQHHKNGKTNNLQHNLRNDMWKCGYLRMCIIKDISCWKIIYQTWYVKFNSTTLASHPFHFERQSTTITLAISGIAFNRFYRW